MWNEIQSNMNDLKLEIQNRLNQNRNDFRVQIQTMANYPLVKQLVDKIIEKLT